MTQLKLVNLLNFTLGIAIASTPWVVGFGFGSNDVNVIMWNFMMVGAISVFTSVMNINKVQMWGSWLNLFMGVYLMFSPLFLFYYNNTFFTEISVSTGFFIAVLSYLSVQSMRRSFRLIHLRRKHQPEAINNNHINNNKAA